MNSSNDRLAEVQRILDYYDECDESVVAGAHQCSVEDRWRLYRDLHEVLARPGD